jgi:hypothetical protein
MRKITSRSEGPAWATSDECLLFDSLGWEPDRVLEAPLDSALIIHARAREVEAPKGR